MPTDKIKYYEKRIEMLEGTLRATEKVLFSSLVTGALRHFLRVKPALRQSINNTLERLRKLQEASMRRHGRLPQKRKRCIMSAIVCVHLFRGRSRAVKHKGYRSRSCSKSGAWPRPGYRNAFWSRSRTIHNHWRVFLSISRAYTCEYPCSREWTRNKYLNKIENEIMNP